jgi:hypothetical protein
MVRGPHAGRSPIPSFLAIGLAVFLGASLAARVDAAEKKEPKPAPAKKAKDAGEKPKPAPDEAGAGSGSEGGGESKAGSDIGGEDDAGKTGSGKSDEGKDKEKDKKATGKKGEWQPLTAEESEVRQGLKEFLHPTSIEFLPDGRVKLVYDFKKRDEDTGKAFGPKPPGNEPKDKFRWALPWEEGSYGSSGSSSSSSSSSRYGYAEGLRVGMEGLAYLDCWFKGEVEAEMDYLQGVGVNARQQAALAFINPSWGSLAATVGAQCALFQKISIQKVKGATDPYVSWKVLTVKLAVKEGKFEAYRGGKLKQEMDYSAKNFSSGRIGFIWSGGVAAFISRLEVVGRLDVKKMAEEMKKESKKR